MKPIPPAPILRKRDLRAYRPARPRPRWPRRLGYALAAGGLLAGAWALWRWRWDIVWRLPNWFDPISLD